MDYKINNIQTVLRVKNIGVRGLAEVIDTTKGTAQNKKDGKTEFTISEGGKLARHLEVPIDLLFYGDLDISKSP